MKRAFLILGLLLVLVVAGAILWWYNTKSYSPENRVTFEEGGLRISITYNRPYKKGRLIFGGLVPYGETWRTGANEATTFETNQDLLIGEKKLPKGKYSLWTIPQETSWQVIFNTSIPPWGIDVMKDGKAARDPEGQEVIVEIPVMNSPKEIEQFTITVEKSADVIEMVLMWDRTLVAVPIAPSGQ